MDKIEQNDLDNAPSLPKELTKPVMVELTKEEFEKSLKQLDNPVELQKDLAVKLKHFLDAQIKKETEQSGMLSDYTRRWIKDYNDILDKIQKSLHGDKHVYEHFGKVTHAHIAAKMRKLKNITPKEVIQVDEKSKD